MAHQVLRLDVNGNPMEWLSALEATYYYAKGLVAWTYGEPFVVLRGGRNRDGDPTRMEIHPVIANRGSVWRNMPPPPLTNAALFQRDERTCLYCGGTFRDSLLTREHIIPQAQGGPDTWMNTVAACVRCNGRKANRTPEQAGMPLLAVPYVPNQAEYLFLMRNRRVLGCQMELLRSRFRSARILEQTRDWEAEAA
jgi:hypothetical protein